MDQMSRFAVYFAPRPGAFADRAAEWLGRDALTGARLRQPDLPGLHWPAPAITKDPRRYGFHGTIRAPFRLAEGITAAAAAGVVARLAAGLAPVTCDRLRLQNLHGFLALTPDGSGEALMALAAAVVEGTEALRAPLTGSELARRQSAGLSPRQSELLDRWGYPYVMEEFRFHLTLTERLPPDQAPVAMAALWAHFSPVLPRPFAIEDLCLFGEETGGEFRLLHRYALTG